MEGGEWVDEVERRVDDAIEQLNTTDPLTIRRLNAWKLRVKGYSHEAIAEQLNVSIAQAYRDVQWCMKNLPAAYESAEDFRRVSLRRLDEMIMQLDTGRELGDESVHRVTMSLLDMQAKLLGAYAATKVEGQMQVRYSLDVPVDDV